MQRYILNNETKTFYETDIHHIKNVMRMKNDDKIIVCLKSKCYLAKLKINQDISYEMIEELDSAENQIKVSVVQGLLKGSKLDTTVKYGTIFGANEFILVPFERSIGKIKNSDYKVERFFNIAKEAAELSHREQVPNIIMIEKLTKVNWEMFDLIIVADEEEKIQTVSNLHYNPQENLHIAIIIGPEGGITNNERNYFKKLQTSSISLGKYIFPAEIAAIKLLNELKR